MKAFSLSEYQLESEHSHLFPGKILHSFKVMMKEHQRKM